MKIEKLSYEVTTRVILYLQYIPEQYNFHYNYALPGFNWLSTVCGDSEAQENPEILWHRYMSDSNKLLDILAKFSQAGKPKLTKLGLPCWMQDRPGYGNSRTGEFLLFDDDSWVSAFKDSEESEDQYVYVYIQTPNVHAKTWRVYLGGLDDWSYSLEVATEEEAIKELTWLREHQPLNLEDDIIGRGLEFTN